MLGSNHIARSQIVHLIEYGFQLLQELHELLAHNTAALGIFFHQNSSLMKMANEKKNDSILFLNDPKKGALLKDRAFQCASGFRSERELSFVSFCRNEAS